MASKPPQPKPAPKAPKAPKPVKFELESYAYNWRSRNNLKQNRGR